jgi:hypothetical protein
MGMVGACQLSDYAASKAALMTLHDSLRYELDKRYALAYPHVSLTEHALQVQRPERAHDTRDARTHPHTHVLADGMAQVAHLEILCAVAPANHRRQGRHPGDRQPALGDDLPTVLRQLCVCASCDAVVCARLLSMGMCVV